MKRLAALLGGVLLLALGAPAALAQAPAAAAEEKDAAEGVTPAAAEAEAGTAPESETNVEAAAQAAPPPRPKATSMDDLLKRVQGGWNAEREENREREARFEQQRDHQLELLEKANATRAREEARSERLERAFEGNDLELAQLEETLRERLGALGELFGVVRQVSGDTRSVVDSSLVSAQFGDREKFLAELAKSKSLPSVGALEKLWFAMLQEMTELGRVTRFEALVVDSDGKRSTREVIRVGGFNAISDGKYLVFKSGKLQELPRQPAGTYLGTVEPFESATSGLAKLAIDPSRGAILQVLIEVPDAAERVEQGGIVGYAIITLGLLAGVLAIVRWFIVVNAGRKVATQTRSDVASRDNPLGRVLGIYEDNPNVDLQTLELKLDESIMRETSTLERLLWAVRVVSVVAPLMGLLGTVTGMIQTFQAITLFGTGDPKMMASGISEALVTTMLGLIVAIPLVLLHAMVSNSSKSVIQILEQQAAGLIARKAEQEEDAA
jgi:biopolymer transport protein ExbB